VDGPEEDHGREKEVHIVEYYIYIINVKSVKKALKGIYI
jgi:hypothetical protein